MIPVLSREQMRAFDALAIESGVPSLVLMENAGRNAASVIKERLEDSGGARVLVFSGPGNNGGDGLVVARHLRAAGVDVSVLLACASERLQGDALENMKAWRACGGDVIEVVGAGAAEQVHSALSGLGSGGVVVDALLGTGLDRPVTGDAAAIIRALAADGADVVSLDVPSGIDANTGAVLGVAVRASMTVTFAHLKLGLLTSTGAEHSGPVEVVDIGVPDDPPASIGVSASLLESRDVTEVLVPRRVSAHKGSAGHVLVVAGSMGKLGAALLVARGALRTGAGLVTLAARPDVADMLDQRVLEEMTARIDPGRIESSLDEMLSRASVVVIGPGLGLDDVARHVVEHVVLRWDGTKIVDADALTCFADRAAALAGARGRLVLTPHPGELGRLLGTSARGVESDRFGALARVVDATQAVVLLKGPRTLVGAPGALPVVNASGTPALATAGSGDVLAGMLGAWACALEPFTAAWVAAHIHGLAAERWQRSHGADRGLLAHELADGVPDVLAGLASDA